ncbi:MAG: NAD(P)-dependent oxidoreductase, partial [Ignavibacteria bacterium]|nr:NAD(P)-dependent oxidoreductase [Ignavibacteria bacterium]
MLKLIVDENIAFADKAFNQFGNVTLLPGREITNSILKDADVLIVRSITNVNEELLKNTNVKFVGTATIGTDHIDVEYLKKNNIAFADAKGCNAYSVAEYVIAALLNLAVKFDLQLSDKSIGIVGVGNVGSKVARFAEALGMKVLLNDPPLQRFYENSKAVISKDPECFRDEKS